MFTRARLIWIAIFAVAVSLLAGGVWTLAWRAALDGLAAKGAAGLALAADRLTGQLFRTRELAVVLAEHPDLVALLADGGDGARASALLRRIADRTGAQSLMLVDRDGRVVAASATGAPVRIDPASAPLARARNGALGSAQRIAPAKDGSPRRLFSFAAPVFGAPGPALGAVLAEVDARRFETDWPTTPAVVWFVGEGGRVMVTNRSELALRARTGDDFLGQQVRRVAGHDLWRLAAGPYLPGEALHLARDLPVVGLRAEALIDTAPARSRALLEVAVAAALALVFGTFLFLAAERRRTLAQANHALEARVAARTRALSEANRDLTREIAERREAEAALRQAQADLVQAGKLSALGQMSAGLSHELNQPLMALRSFADNALEFLRRGRPERARANLERIADLARRMDRIIRNLRAFARNEREPVGRVDLGAVIDTAVELTAARLRAEGVELDWTRPPAPVLVQGGEVRLAQVLVNLINNATDAMAGQPGPRRIAITVSPGTPDDPRPRVELADSGPGIEDPERIFEPFYTTKAAPASGEGDEGMGLGLSISYGLVQSFGGDIRGANRPGGGAVFTVVLAPWTDDAAARPGDEAAA